MAGQLKSNDLTPSVISVSVALLSLLFTLGWGTRAWSDVSDAEMIVVPLSFDPKNNLLAGENGTEVVRVPSNPAAAERLIDGSPRGGWQSAESFASNQPIELLFRLPGERRLASLLVQPQSNWPGVAMPQDLEILVGLNEEENAFVSLGHFRLHRKSGWQRLHFPAHKIVFLKLRIHSIHGSGPVGLGEVAAFAPGIDTLAPRYYYEAAMVPVVSQPVEKKTVSSQVESDRQAKVEEPAPAVTLEIKEIPPVKKLPLKQRISSELKRNGYGALFFYLRDDKEALLTGLVGSEQDRQQAVKIVQGFAEVRAVHAHLLSGSSSEIHPRDIRSQANTAMQSAGLNNVQVRMRKRGELILVGQVKSSEEEQVALAIAGSQPGISEIVNQLSK
jgi:hypothetical protein